MDRVFAQYIDSVFKHGDKLTDMLSKESWGLQKWTNELIWYSWCPNLTKFTTSPLVALALMELFHLAVITEFNHRKLANPDILETEC